MEYIVRRKFDSKLTTGIVGVILCFLYAMVYWPIWAFAAKAIISATAAKGLALVDAKTSGKFIAVFVEGTFFWCSINAWVWQTLIFGNYAKYKCGELQPKAGIWYTFLSFVCGSAAYLIIVSFIGLWWKPFSLSLMFSPETAADVHLAIEAWEASNFYVLPVLIAQIPFVSLFGKKPWAGMLKPPYDGVAVMMTTSFVALLVWVGLFIPSFFPLQMGGHAITSQPLGSWPAVLAFCQGFIFWFLMPAEGGEGYPYKAITAKQPWMGLSGVLIALVCGGFLMPRFYVWLIGAFNINPGVNPLITTASLELSVIVFLLCWHHLFDDYPGVDVAPNLANRILTRMVIWVVGGSAFGFTWLQVYKFLPFAGTDLGMGYPVMGILAGQFALLMVFLYFNTFFDKWPLVWKEKA